MSEKLILEDASNFPILDEQKESSTPTSQEEILQPQIQQEVDGDLDKRSVHTVDSVKQSDLPPIIEAKRERGKPQFEDIYYYVYGTEGLFSEELENRQRRNLLNLIINTDSLDELKQIINEYGFIFSSEQNTELQRMLGELSPQTNRPEVSEVDSDPLSHVQFNRILTNIPESIPVSVPESVEAQVFDQLGDEEKIKNKGFEDIRREYATEQAKWKKEQGELKVKFNRIMEGLFRKADSIGEKIVEKVSGKTYENTWNPPKRVPPPEFEDSKKQYINAKKEHLKKSLEGVAEEDKIETILKFEKEEFDKMEKLIQDGLPEKEKSFAKQTVQSGLKKWRELSPARRIAISSTLMGVGGAVAFGSAGIIPIAGAVAYRAARGVTGALASYGTARSVDAIYDGKFMKERDAQRKNKILEKNKQEYTVDLDKYEEIEKKSREYFENEQKRLKYKNIAKASAVVLAGGAVNLGMNWGVSLYNHVDDTVSKPSTLEVKGGATVSTESEKPVTLPRIEHVKVGPEIPPKTIETELNGRGFIKTFDDLKKNILKEYGGDPSRLPKNLKTFVDTPSTKLAIDNGLYDPSHNASAMGLTGEHLSVDEKGHLTLKHLGDKPAEAIDTGSHKFNALHKDKMFTPKVSPADTAMATEPPEGAPATLASGEAGSFTDPVTDTPSSYSEEGISNNENDQIVLKNSHKYQTLTNEALTDVDHVAPIEATSEIKINTDGVQQWIPKGATTPLATEHLFEGKKIFQLADSLQDSYSYSGIRAEFAKVFERTVDINTLGRVVKPIPFEGGIAHVVQGANDKVHVLLNGKPIAEGLVDVQGAHVKLLPGMQRGGAFRFIFADNAFERVFKSNAMTDAIKTLKVVQK